MRSKRFIQLAAGIMAGVAVSIALLGFLCPQDVMSSGMSEALSAPTRTTAFCPGNLAASSMPGSMGVQTNCLNLHLGFVNRLTEYVVGKAVLWFTLILAIAVIYFVTSKFLNRAQPGLARFKHRSWLYSTSIRLYCQKKFLAWLSLLENHGIAVSV